MKTHNLLILSSLVLGVHSAQAVTTISFSSSVPFASYADYSHTTIASGSNGGQRGWNANRTIAQTFSATSSWDLGSITVLTTAAYTLGTDTNYTLRIHELSGSVFNSTEFGNSIYSSTGSLIARPSGDNYLTFGLDSTVALESGKTYAISFDFTDPTAGSSIGLQTTYGTNAYPNGVWYERAYNAGTSSWGNWTATGTNGDLNFWLNPVPEPSAAIISAFGALGLLRRKR